MHAVVVDEAERAVGRDQEVAVLEVAVADAELDARRPFSRSVGRRS
ncbi:hypothetical protein [Streptomyces sp. NPDC088557]